jgi:phage shock protein E
MLHFVKKLFGTNSTNISEVIQKGCLILDVRTKGEYSSGHVKGSKNIPLNELSGQMKSLKKDLPIVTCCASGMRSASAASLLRNAGFEAYNGGSWTSVQSKMN